MGATASRVIRIQAPPEVAYRAAEAALTAMGLQVAERIPDRKYLAASIPISLWSVGERIEILVDPAEAGSSRVAVTSTFKSPWQRANLAKTERNIDTFEAALLKQVSLADALGTTVRQPSQDIRIFISYRRDDFGWRWHLAQYVAKSRSAFRNASHATFRRRAWVPGNVKGNNYH